MKALALLPDSSAEMISGGFLNTTFTASGSSSGTQSSSTVKQTNNVGSTGIALLAIGKGKFKF
jgi:hypothetical protein